MQAELEDFKMGWYDLTLGLNTDDIDKLIATPQKTRTSKGHFHFRSKY